jgi:protein-disulfide isomerase
VRELLASSDDDVRYVWRHLPLNDVHSSAQLAAEAVEAAGAQGRFWEMYDAFLAHQDALTPQDISKVAHDLGLDVERFWSEIRRHEHAPRVAEDVASADASGVSGTPTFFVNGRRHQGAYDLSTLKASVRAARNRALVAAQRRSSAPSASP